MQSGTADHEYKENPPFFRKLIAGILADLSASYGDVNHQRLEFSLCVMYGQFPFVELDAEVTRLVGNPTTGAVKDGRVVLWINGCWVFARISNHISAIMALLCLLGEGGV